MSELSVSGPSMSGSFASEPSTSMLAWTFEEHGDPATVLSLSRIDVPEPTDDQILVAVEAAAVNFADVLLIRGTYQSAPPLPAVAGMELTGRVVAAGSTSGFSPEDRVAGLGHRLSGAFAEYALLDAGSAFVPPAAYTAAEAAAFTVAYQTAWFAIHVRGRVQPGELVIVHAAAGGVGTACAQLAVAAGARVIGVVGGADKVSAARLAGCAEVVLRDDPDVVTRIKTITDGGADVVIDPVGGTSHAISERVVGFDGRIVLVGFAGGDLPVIRPDLVLVKNIAVVGLHWGLYRAERPRVVVEEYERLVGCVQDARIRPVVSAVRALDDLPRTLDEVEHGRSIGRVVLATGEARPPPSAGARHR